MYRLDFTNGADCVGPLGFKMKEKAARELEVILKAEGQEAAGSYRKYVVDDQEAVSEKKRTDTSWITLESPDKQKEVILTDGINKSVIDRNNVVTINHNLPVIGKCVWAKPWEENGKKGMLAKTEYLGRPDGWNDADKWIGDTIFDLVCKKSLTGKSVGILPVPGQVRGPTQQEVDANPSWQGCKVYQRSYLVEYAVCPNPVHPDALVLTVQKAFPDAADQLAGLLGLQLAAKADPQNPDDPTPKDDDTIYVEPGDPDPHRKIHMIPITAVHLIVKGMLGKVNWDQVGRELAASAVYKKTGRIVQ